MVITPTLRGLFRISIDAQTKTITVNPHLPASWEHADVSELQVPGGTVELKFRREEGGLRATLIPFGVQGWTLRTDAAGSKSDKQGTEAVIVPLHAIELGELHLDFPNPGSRTTQARVLSERWKTNSVTLTVEGIAGSWAFCPVRRHGSTKVGLSVEDGLSTEADETHPGVSGRG